MTATTDDDAPPTDPSTGLPARVAAAHRDLQRRLGRSAPARMLAALPRTGAFAGRTLGRGRDPGRDGPPVPSLSPALLAHVALDEAILLAAMGPNRFPTRGEYRRVGDELRAARDLWAAEGWLHDPTTYHRTPPPLERPQTQSGWALGLRYERLSFDSGYEPHDDEPGRTRWLDYATNRVAGAWVLRHDDGPRPWVVAVHGFGTGSAFMDFPALGVATLHHDLGCNVIGPLLPLHGRRKITRLSGEAFLSFDLIDTVHGLAQAVWDVRRLLSWVEAQDPTAVGVYGVSLGGYLASLLVGLHDGIDCVVAGIPVSDFPALYSSHAPAHIRMRAIEHEILGGPAEEVHRVVSPLSFAPRVPHEHRAVYAGLGDRVARPRQAWQLWHHWGDPEILWFPGSHVGYLWSGAVGAFVRRNLRRGLGIEEPTDTERAAGADR